MKKYLALPLLLFLPACTTIPPIPTAQTLLPGQSSGSFEFKQEQSSGGGQSMVAAGGGYRSSMPWRGTDWGASLDEWLDLYVDLKQALWIPRDPQGLAVAMDGEAQGGVFGQDGYGGALVLTQPLGRCSFTLGSRYGWIQREFTGPSEGFGPALIGPLQSDYLDFFGAFEFPCGNNGDFLLGFTWRKLINPAIQNDLGDALAVPTGWSGVELSWRFTNAIPFLGDRWASPRRWIPGDSPDQVPAAEHIAMARQLRRSKLYADAIDELNAAQRQDPRPGAADIELGDDYSMLGEWELAYFHYERAAQAFPEASYLRDDMDKIYPLMRYR